MTLSSRQAKQLLANRDYEGLVDLLTHGRRRERRNAIRALGELGDSRAVVPLSAALDSAYGNDEDLPPVIVQALGRLETPDAVEQLEKLLADRRDDDFYFHAHREALFALAASGAFEALQAIASDQSRDPVLRREAEALVSRHRSH